jgi:hypothetical protein
MFKPLIALLNTSNDGIESPYPSLIRSWGVPNSFVSGIAANDDIREVQYNASWGARPHRCLASDRNTYPGRIVSKLYSTADINGAWTDDGVVFDNSDTYCFPYGILYDSDLSLYVATYIGPQGGGGENIGIMTSSDMVTWADKGFKLTPQVSPVPIDIVRIFGGGFVKHSGYYYLAVAEYPTDASLNYYETKAIALYRTNDLTDYNTWERYQEIVYPDPHNEWEEQRASETSLIWSDKDRVWVLYYQGGNVNDLKREVGIAYSPTLGAQFTKVYANPRITDPYSTNRIGTPNVSFCGAPNIFKDEINETYHIFMRSYDGSDWRAKKCTFT